MSKICLAVLAAILTIISTKTVNGAELYCKFSYGIELNNATVDVTCGNWEEKNLPITGEGKIYVRGLPGNRSCYLTVANPPFYPSSKVRFSTQSSVVSINARLKIIEN